MSDRKPDSGSKSTLEIILEFGHKSVLKEKTVQVVEGKIIIINQM